MYQKVVSFTVIGLINSVSLFAQVIDIDKNQYRTVKIKKQVWMAENLNVSHFRNGDKILQAKTSEEWKRAAEQKTPAWCYYNNDESNGKKYGKLYNWYALIDSRGLAPKGWRVPTDQDFSILGDNTDAHEHSEKLMVGEWKNRSEKKNESGFSALPTGNRGFDGTSDNNYIFEDLGKFTAFWCLDEQSEGGKHAAARSIGSNFKVLAGDFFDKSLGLSVRCIKK